MAPLTLGLLAQSARPVSAAPARHAEWSSPSALTVQPGRWELGVLSESSWGASERLELRLHPLLFWALPHAELKVRWGNAGPLYLSSVHRLSFPTPLLSLVSREGSGGLLPPDSDVPVAALVDGDVLGSFEWRPGHLLSARLGAQLAVGHVSEDAVVLDFPFLYQRLAGLYAPIVPRASLVASGRLTHRLGYELEARHYVIPLSDYDTFQASELSGAVSIFLGSSHRLELGGRLSSARLPVGRREHFLPHVDYRISF